ncbi:MAG: methyltransferase domain-containing protein [Chlorobi bacterium]|nr:methyltransferase domain-containing protein [Chlorobiota bacterium]
MKKITVNFWEEQYDNKRTGWDVGYATKPITDYVDQIKNKEIKILVPGAGNGYEVEYLYKAGFKNTFLLDYTKYPLENFKKRVPVFPDKNIIQEDFFNHSRKYDLIIEQTFFCSLLKADREKYVKKTYNLLKPGGRIIGVLFNHEFGLESPPYGGTKDEYLKLFSKFFLIKKLELSHNSIKPRKGKELFFIFEKNDL